MWIYQEENVSDMYLSLISRSRRLHMLVLRVQWLLRLVAGLLQPSLPLKSNYLTEWSPIMLQLFLQYNYLELQQQFIRRDFGAIDPILLWLLLEVSAIERPIKLLILQDRLSFLHTSLLHAGRPKHLGCG